MSIAQEGQHPILPVRKDRAAALEKGLDVLEAISESNEPVTIGALANRMSRSIADIARVVNILVERGYVAPDPEGHRYEVSPRLLLIARTSHPTRLLTAKAPPHMQALSRRLHHSCQLGVAVDQDVVVIASSDAPGEFSLNVRPGHQASIMTSAAGRMIYGLQTIDERDRLASRLRRFADRQSWDDFNAAAEKARIDMHCLALSSIMPGIIDMAAPVFDRTGVAGALIVPIVRSRLNMEMDRALEVLHEACADLSSALGCSRLPLASGACTISRRNARPHLKLIK